MALYPRIPFSTLVDYDPSILDSFYYPAGALAGTPADFVSYFQLEYGEMTPIYQEPSLLKEHIRVVAAAIKPTLDAWLEVLQQEYNPLENYDRDEKSRDVRLPNLKDKTEITHGKANTITGGHKDDWPIHNVERRVAADNTAAYYEAEKTIEDAHSITRTYNTEKNQESGKTTNENGLTGSDTNTHESRIHGNIGVLTSQEMLQAELDVRRFDYMMEAGRLYAEKLLIMLY
ncbi:MAG: hypothetical protein J6Q80_02150 [Lentisphaeria bacterium]|nr:hypothetical protein [Lentisphaeria bacterium]